VASVPARSSSCWRRFGRGRHPAALNFGDCCSKAATSLAPVSRAPPLRQGESPPFYGALFTWKIRVVPLTSFDVTTSAFPFGLSSSLINRIPSGD